MISSSATFAHGRGRSKWQAGDPIGSKPPFNQAAEAQAVAKKGNIGKVLL
jgi:hypothetical protein